MSRCATLTLAFGVLSRLTDAKDEMLNMSIEVISFAIPFLRAR